jgi:hypothetical protein
VAHLDVFSHVFEHVFLLQQENVIHQALLYMCGESGNPCTIYALLQSPLTPLPLATYGRTYNAPPLSNACKNWITHFQNMYDHCSYQTAWFDHNIFDLNLIPL